MKMKLTNVFHKKFPQFLLVHIKKCLNENTMKTTLFQFYS